MEKTVTMPKLGMTMEEGEVLNWRYKEGDSVAKGEPLVEIMTDKVNIEFESPFDGHLVRILARDGDVLPVGSPIAVMNDGKEEVTPAQEVSLVTQHEAPESLALLASVQDGNVKRLLHQHPVPSTPAAKRAATSYGIALHAVEQSGAKLPLRLSDITAYVEQTSKRNGQVHQPSASGIASTPDVEIATSPQTSVRATPVAQKIAKEHQIDLTVIAENKASGKVTRADVEAHLADRLQEAKPTQAVPATSSVQHAEESEVIPLTSTRRLIGQRMVQSITTAPHIYLDVDIDMTEAERCRQRIGHSLQDKGVPIPSVTALLIQASAKALLLHPDVNATLEAVGPQGKDAIRRWRHVHIGIAVDTERALLTPVIRNAHQQSLQEIAQSLKRITAAAREGTLKPDDLVGATFTISNLGMYGINTFHAIIAPGQSAILAVGKITKQPIVVEEDGEDRIEIRPMMKVSLSADHRVLDGASGSRFLYQLKTFLEDPYLLL